MTVSAPQRVAHVIFSTSSSIEEATAELPMFALILTRKLRPIAIGSDSGWLTLAGMIARPRATSSRTNSGDMPSRSATNSISGVTIALPRVVHLRDVAASAKRATAARQGEIGRALTRTGVAAVVLAAGEDPRKPQLRKPRVEVDRRGRVRVRAGRVVDAQRRVQLRLAAASPRRVERDLAERNAHAARPAT